MSTSRIDLGKMLLNGTDAHKQVAELREASTGITMTETLTGASSVEISIQDGDRRLLRSGLLDERATIVLDNAGFELAGVRKVGDSARIVFEDIAIAAMRRQKSFRKIKPGQMSRAAFVTDLVRRDARWIRVETRPGPRALVELSRGTAKTKTQAAQPEDTWAAANRIMGEIQWRVWARRGTLYILDDDYLRKQTPIVLSERSPGVDNIDLDYDVGKPTATATITGRAGFRDLAPGTAVQLDGMGPGSRIWLVETITRDPATTQVSVQLVLPLPDLPEPKRTDPAGDGGDEGWDPTDLPEDPDLDTGVGAPDASVEKFVQIALAQRGKPYVWGHSGPGDFDCSGLVQYAAARAGFEGIHKPVTSLYAECKSKGKLISVSEAIRTRGAVLMRIGQGGTNHVAISLGNGRTMEARGRAYGCVIANAAGRFTNGGLLPGMFGAKKKAPVVPVRPDDGNIPFGS